MSSDTIAALASGPPPAAVSVIRLSGPAALSSLAALTGGPAPPPRRLSLRTLRDPRDATPLDNALVVAFPGPGTASGEDLVELHLHGGVAVVSGVLAALTALPGVRLALPGEFTRRAFTNGRMDLAQVEGIADLVAAETAGQRRSAMALAGGALSRSADSWRSRCLDILAEAEAGLDFAEDEADVASRIDEAARDQLLTLVAELQALIADAARGQRLRNGLTITVTGPPNVGKSSLVNMLTNSDAAIVTPIAGTTRDPIEVPIDLDGVAAVLIETTMGSAGCIPGSPEYLRGLQEVAHEVGALFIVDEVMTSRLSPSGSSPGLGLEPDLITLGKYLGGGLSFGAFGGRADLMGLFDPTRPTPLQHAGTFNNNVLTMAAGLAGLTHVLTPEAVDALNARGDRLRESLQQVVAPHGWTAIGRGSMVCLHPVTGPVTSPSDLASADSGLRELLFLELLERGWYMALRGFMALSLEVSDDDVDGFVSVVGEVLGSWPTSG